MAPEPCSWCGIANGTHVWSHNLGRAHPKCVEEATAALRELEPRPELWRGILKDMKEE